MPASVPASAAASAAAPLQGVPARPAPPAYAGAAGTPAAALPINFDLGSSRVDRSSLPYIEAIASLLRSDPSLNLVIEGHTDDTGAYNRNMVLSWDRALGVFRTLVESYGIDAGRLQPVGKGPNDPMSGTNPADASNRRVQFRISG
jgi:OOP family OmpA-OmpF porin